MHSTMYRRNVLRDKSVFQYSLKYEKIKRSEFKLLVMNNQFIFQKCIKILLTPNREKI